MSRKALVIGIDEYPRCPLSCCVRDATALAQRLETHGNGEPNFEVSKLMNPPSVDQIDEAIEHLFAGDDDVALFYFSGHGCNVKKQSWICVPESLRDRTQPGIAINQIIDSANTSKVRDKILIFDSCFAGGAGTYTSESISMEIMTGTTILCACRANETAGAGDEYGYSVFTDLLIDALDGGAADSIGCITPGSVYAYIDQALGAWEQRPVFKTNVCRFTPLRYIQPTVDKESIRKVFALFDKPDAIFPLDSSYEYSNHPEWVPELHEPYANKSNVEIFKIMQKMVRVHLLEPYGEDHMYYAAMKGKGCCLTELGKHFWHMFKQKRF